MKSYLFLFGIAFGSITENDGRKEPEAIELFAQEFYVWCALWGYSFNKGSLLASII